MPFSLPAGSSSERLVDHRGVRCSRVEKVGKGGKETERDKFVLEVLLSQEFFFFLAEFAESSPPK